MTDELSDDLLGAAADVVTVLETCGLNEREVIEAAVEHGGDAETPVEAVAKELDALYGSRSTTSAAKTGTLQQLLAASTVGVVTDSRYDHKKTLEPALDAALSNFGYGFSLESVGADEWVELDGRHPRTVHLVVTDRAGETVSSRPFRYPPVASGAWPSAQRQGALGVALNDTVFDDVGLHLCFLDQGSEHYEWVLLPAETLSTLVETYGPSVRVCDDPLVRRSPRYADSWTDVDSEHAVDHEVAFGVPEPRDTYKVEVKYDLTDPTSQPLW